jgi:hypothetical protein
MNNHSPSNSIENAARAGLVSAVAHFYILIGCLARFGGSFFPLQDKRSV